MQSKSWTGFYMIGASVMKELADRNDELRLVKFQCDYGETRNFVVNKELKNSFKQPPVFIYLKAHSQVSAERPLRMMKNAFYFTSKSLFVLKAFKILSCLFGHVAKRVDKKDKVNFKFYDVTAWLTNSCNTHIAAQYLEK